MLDMMKKYITAVFVELKATKQGVVCYIVFPFASKFFFLYFYHTLFHLITAVCFFSLSQFLLMSMTHRHCHHVNPLFF